MFRAQSNLFDDVVVKATDENLTSENWEYILDVCDKVGSADTGAQQAVAAMIKRLAHRNANVQLYTLELANALSQNCGVPMHKELASRSFTDALLRLANDRNTHQQVKAKILERMGEWSDMFSRDPDLGIMQGAYNKLKSQNPNLRAPSKPQKTQISDTDRQKEEEELQMALAMSIRESKGSAPATAKSNAPQDASAGASSSAQPAQAPAPAPQGTTAATVSRVRALYDFQPSEPGELQFKKGDIIAVLESVYKDWWKGSLRGQTGIFPLNYVEKLQDPTREELEREAQMEAEVFAQIRNVEKLLALLSTSSQGGGDVRDNEEITELYHSTLAIRPKLIELIGKYSQKKDDFTQLNEKFIKGRRDYESLLEASMTQAAQPAYGGRPAYGAYSAPSPSQYAGYPPSAATPQQDPSRFYGAGAPPSQGPSGQYPPAGSTPAFFMVPPGEQRQQPTPAPQAGPPSNAYNDPSLSRVPVGRPQSFAPQELSTGHYDSPVDNRQSFHGAPQGAPPAGQEYPYPPAQQQSQPPGYPPQSSAPPQNPYDHITSPPPQPQPQPHDQQPSSDPYAPGPQQNQYGYPPQQQPSQPGYAPPAPPGATGSPAPQSQAYLPYRPGGQAPSAPVGGDGGEEGFYR
ncbi:ESCRT-0 subunit protein hse1 [Ascochyta rabiei]|uniref:ESCRT-0 subunit protein hse1 n=1 Tax=Didymella rabiei TaxID=5454 RepID=UPI0021FD38FF|nr:ESCRT-0 subunit protein hse1 [Ascochyta rabiei]UPX20365.1 ESCRT-0 subunit protein hse1 [Ascochyta rabiei]